MGSGWKGSTAYFTLTTTEMDFNVTTSTNSSRGSRADLPTMPSLLETIIMYSIIIGAMLSNIMVFYVLPRLKGKIRAQTRYCMVSLLITDSMFGFGGLVTKTTFITNIKFFMDYICYLEGILASFLVDMTIVGLTLLNTDRVLVILIPTKYDPWMTKRKFLVIIVSLWICFIIRFSVASSIPSIAEKSYLEGAYICLLKYPTRKFFTATSIVVLLVVPFGNCIASIIALVKILKRRKRTANTNRNAKSKESATVLSAIFFLTTIYFFMAAPFCICVLIWQVFTGDTLSPRANFITIHLLACNSLVNPYIYLATMKSYRRVLLRGILKLTGNEKEQQTFDDSRMSTHGFIITRL